MKIDEWLPEYQVSSQYSLAVGASAEQTYGALVRAKLVDLPIVRGLMRLRGYRLSDKAATESQAPEQCRFGSFLKLAMIPQKEVVLGIVGRFWRPDGGIVRGLTPEEFRTFHRDGYARAVWNFSLSPQDGGTRVSTETRVQTFGLSATLKFRLYWLVVGPFSGLIRRTMLREIKRTAEGSPA
jgi:hypothetical protein